MIVDTMTGKDIVREFNRDIDSIDKIAERMAVKNIHIEGIRTVTETFVNGKLARKRFNELKRKP